MAQDFRSFMNPPRVVDELVAEQAAWAMSSEEHREETILRTARDMQKENKDDPFTYNRVTSLLRSNMATPSDYRKRLNKRR